jgi:outer membrane receptor protein involved in Fe transport
MKDHTAARGISFRAILFAGATAMVLPSAAFAQDEPAEGNQIVVTATKSEKTLQDTPVAVSVTTGESIERAEIRDIKDLQMVVPSLKVTQLQSSANTNFIIRGFGNGANNAGIEPSVGVFVDGVYRSRTASRVNDLPAVQRIEVLRGPQSTLFGKNASAGVISVITEEPQFETGGSVEAGYGNYNAIVAKGYVTGPLSETIAASFGAGYASRDGYIEDLGPAGGDTNERNRWFVRGQLLFEPNSDLKIRIIGDYDEQDETCCGVVNLARSAATNAILALGGNVNPLDGRFDDQVYNNFPSENDIKNWGVSAQIDYDFGGATVTSITSYRESHAITSQDSDFTSADLIYPNAADVRLDTFTQELRLAAELGDSIDVLLGAFYITENVEQTGQLYWGQAARNYANILVQSQSGCALSLFGGALAFCPPGPAPTSLETTFGALEGNPAKYTGAFFRAGNGFNEAYTLDSEAFSLFGQVDFEVTDGLTLTVGGNYTDDSKDFSANIVSTDVFSTINFNAPAYAPFRAALLDGGFKAQAAGMALGLGRNATAAEIFALATGTSSLGAPGAALYAGTIVPGAAAFAAANMNNAALNPLNALKPFQFLPPFLGVPNSVEDGHIGDDDFSYTVRLAYDVSPDVNIYASYATGFKAGSVNLSRDSRPLPADAAALTTAGLVQVNQTYGSRFADPEKAKVMELGIKGDWGSGSANVAIFDQVIKNFQSNVFTGSGFALANAGKQSTWGVEFEGRQEVVEGFVVNLGVTYLDPTYDEFLLSSVGDLSGLRPAGIPEWTVVVGGNYTHELGNGDRIILNGNYHFESEVQIVDGLTAFLAGGSAAAIAAAAPFTRQVDELDASLTYAMEMGLELSIWGRNLLDDRYLLSIFDSVAQPQSISGYPNQPRTWGGTVRFRF